MAASPAIGYAQLLAGGVLLTAAATGHSLRDVIAGRASSLAPLVSDIPIIHNVAGGTTPPAGGQPSNPVDGVPGQQTAGLATSATTAKYFKPAGGGCGNSASNFTQGNTAEIARRLATLAQRKGTIAYGISGFRTPACSVSVGGFANDPHTKGDAIDFGFGAPTLASAARVTDAELASVGLKRPFGGYSEINHVQLA